jgi:hypothetical protein
MSIVTQSVNDLKAPLCWRGVWGEAGLICPNQVSLFL